MSAKSYRLASELQKLSEEGPVDIDEAGMRLTLDIVGLVILEMAPFAKFLTLAILVHIAMSHP